MNRSFDELLSALRGGLMVSCQSRPGEPFDAPHLIAEMARAATLAGDGWTKHAIREYL